MALSIRPGSLADAETFTGLVNDHHEAFTGEPLWSVDEIRAALITTTAQPHRDDRYIERDGVAVAGFHTRSYEPYDVGVHLGDGFTVLEQSFPTPGSNWHLVRDDYEHMMRNDPTALTGLSLMAFRGEKPVGVCINFVDTMRPEAGHIGMLGVARTERRSGIGRALFAASLAKFAEQDWTHARLTTITPASGVGGEDAGGFFRSVGMTTVYDHDIMSRPLIDPR